MNAIQINRKIIKIFVELRKQISTTNEFQILKEKIQSLENEQPSIKTLIDNVQLNQKIDNNILTTKMTQLSKEMFRLTEILDQFQDNHLIIKRPEESNDTKQGP